MPGTLINKDMNDAFFIILFRGWLAMTKHQIGSNSQVVLNHSYPGYKEYAAFLLSEGSGTDYLAAVETPPLIFLPEQAIAFMDALEKKTGEFPADAPLTRCLALIPRLKDLFNNNTTKNQKLLIEALKSSIDGNSYTAYLWRKLYAEFQGFRKLAPKSYFTASNADEFIENVCKIDVKLPNLMRYLWAIKLKNKSHFVAESMTHFALEGLIEAIAGNSSLTSVTFLHINSAKEGTSLAKAIKHNRSLRNLTVAGSGCDDQLALMLSESLILNNTLTSLSFVENRSCRPGYLHDKGASAIAWVISQNSTLTEVILTSQRIGDSGATALARALQTNNTLQKLILTDNNISDEGANALVEVLLVNNCLTVLDLGKNQIKNLNPAALATNNSLRTLILDNNQIFRTLQQAACFTKAIEQNHGLTSLSLEGCGIHHPAALLLARAVAHHISLTHLNLSGNHLTPLNQKNRGLVALAEALKTNASLVELNLSRNFLTPDGLLALADALIVNKSLTTLWLGGAAYINEECAEAFTLALEQNNTLTTLSFDNKIISDLLPLNEDMKRVKCQLQMNQISLFGLLQHLLTEPLDLPDDTPAIIELNEVPQAASSSSSLPGLRFFPPGQDHPAPSAISSRQGIQMP